MSLIFSPDNQRVEKKFICNNFKSKDLYFIIKKLSYGFVKKYNKRRINNVYFDNLDKDNYIQSIEGISNRFKIRLRWYGKFFRVVENANLEIKSKKNFIGFKNSYKINKINIEHKIFKNNKILNEILKNNLEINLLLKNNIVSSVNTYEREYFESFDKKFRITIDYNLKFFNSNLKICKKNFNELCIIEIKTNLKYLNNISSITEELPFRLSRFSKYTEGIESFLD